MSQLDLDFNAPLAPPLEPETAVSTLPPPPGKKLRPKRTVHRDWEKLLWLVRFLPAKARPSALAIFGWCRAVEVQARTSSLDSVADRMERFEMEFPAFYAAMVRHRI